MNAYSYGTSPKAIYLLYKLPKNMASMKEKESEEGVRKRTIKKINIARIKNTIKNTI